MKVVYKPKVNIPVSRLPKLRPTHLKIITMVETCVDSMKAMKQGKRAHIFVTHTYVLEINQHPGGIRHKLGLGGSNIIIRALLFKIPTNRKM